jgi:hypothetical protein
VRSFGPLAICPSGKKSLARENLSSPVDKKNPLRETPKSDLKISHPVPREGRWPSSRTLGWDAVDAAAPGAQM